MKKSISPFVSMFRLVARKPLITGPAVASAWFGVAARTQEKPMDLRRAYLGEPDPDAARDIPQPESQPIRLDADRWT